MGTPSPNSGIRQKALAYLMAREGKQVSALEICKAIDHPLIATRNCLTALVREKGAGIEAPTTGVFMFRQPNERKNGQQSSGRLFEEIGINREGQTILQDEEGTLYLASPLNRG